MTLLMRCKAAAKIVRRTDVDVAVAQLKEINVPQAATVPLRSCGASLPPVGLGWPATRSPTGRRVAEREGFEPPIGLHLCRISSAVHSTTLPPLQAPRRVIHPYGRGVF